MSFSGLHCHLGLGSKFWSAAGHNPELNLELDSGACFSCHFRFTIPISGLMTIKVLTL